ncbi:MAG: FAD-dependent oxidoreductase [Actinomycetota bacterium]|nr:FAD-dependent oxidoreductase [Actinomycetota bacterium]
MMNKVFDLAVIGSGVAGSAVAFECKKKGLDVAIIEKNAFGGTCPNRGCDPKKILWGASQIAASAKKMSHVFDGQIKLDWPQLIKFKKTFTDPVSGKRKKSLEQAGIEVIEGQARFTDPHTLQIESRTIEAEKIVIASGAKPRPMDLEGARHIITSEQFLEYESLPPSILFIGGGYISFEFAHIAVNSGVDITILHIDNRPLSMFDQDLVEQMLELTREAGINFIPNAPARALKSRVTR